MARCSHTTLCDKVCQWLATGRWFSPVIRFPPSIKLTVTITEILLKVSLNTINQTKPFKCSNIPEARAYGIYVCQLIRYSIACGCHHDFLDRDLWLLLTRKLLKQWFLMVNMKSSLWKFHGPHHDLVNRYGISINK